MHLARKLVEAVGMNRLHNAAFVAANRARAEAVYGSFGTLGL